MPSSIPSSSLSPSTVDVCRAIVFSISGCLLALPVAAVVRVTQRCFAQGGASDQSGIVYLDNQPLVLLELHALLPQQQPSSQTASTNRRPGSFLIVAQLESTAPCAIAVDEPPTLMELPLSAVRCLPRSYQQSLRGVAQHVAMLPQLDRTISILLLDLQQAMRVGHPV
ncbi:MAG: hypothetical protein IGS50_06900 [Synechococcales cyanobacterium C42_A2020_086]|jgi:purine-binding chemotaxis protein CheW|nr:hypothetical protein [Synechococcales cyanobacterium C42_A2020_086]